MHDLPVRTYLDAAASSLTNAIIAAGHEVIWSVLRLLCKAMSSGLRACMRDFDPGMQN